MKFQIKFLIPFILLSFNSYAGTIDSDLCKGIGGKYYQSMKLKSVSVLGESVKSVGDYTYIANVFIDGQYHYMINSKNEDLLPIAEMVMMTGSSIDVCTKTSSLTGVDEVTMIVLHDD